MSAREKDRILTTSPTKTPPFLRNITIIARLSTLATLAGTCKNSSAVDLIDLFSTYMYYYSFV